MPSLFNSNLDRYRSDKSTNCLVYSLLSKQKAIPAFRELTDAIFSDLIAFITSSYMFDASLGYFLISWHYVITMCAISELSIVYNAN
jgi:hypothetical protein